MKILINLSVVLLMVLTSCSCRKVEINENDLKADQFYYNGDYKPFSGICVTEYHDTGNIKAVRTMKEGIMNGETIVYYEDGSIRRKGNYMDGKYHGIWIGWYKNGNKEFEVEHKNGMLHGKYTLYFEDGTIKEKGVYSENKRTGEWLVYNEKGNLDQTKKY